MYNNNNDDRNVDIIYDGKYASFMVHGNGATSVLLSGTGATVPWDPNDLHSISPDRPATKILRDGLLIILLNGISTLCFLVSQVEGEKFLAANGADIGVF